ncbi:MAG TPA: DNA-binding protein [Desulfobulbaceae bacterium]|nr:DNA-binding protein [Desulfobulbaceae bacterium]
MFRLRFFPGIFLTMLFLTTICLTLSGNTSAAVTAAKPIQGKVLETMNAGGYTYLRLQENNGDVWVAVPETKVTKGQQVVCQPGMTMTNFKSKTLGRTFDSIIFSSGIGNTTQVSMSNPHGGKAAMTAGKNNSFSEAMRAEHSAGKPAGPMAGGAAMMGGAMMASGGSGSAVVPSKDIKVDKADGDNAFTVGECFSQGKKLNNKKVRVRGKVVKVSRMIMGKNWVHIQDGTGNPMDNTHDLVVTTMADPKLDSVVVVEGTLHANKDFGAGYKYKVIIEDAKIK